MTPYGDSTQPLTADRPPPPVDAPGEAAPPAPAPGPGPLSQPPATVQPLPFGGGTVTPLHARRRLPRPHPTLVTGVLAALLGLLAGLGAGSVSGHEGGGSVPVRAVAASEVTGSGRALAASTADLQEQLGEAVAERDAARAHAADLEQQLTTERARRAEAESVSSNRGTAPVPAQGSTGASPSRTGVSAEDACATATRYFRDHDSALAGVIRGDNDAKRTGHVLGSHIVELQTVAASVGEPLARLVRDYVGVMAAAREVLLSGGDLMDQWDSDGFYETGNALADHCAAVGDPLH